VVSDLTEPSGDIVLFYQFDRLIHQRIAEAAGNTFLLSTVQAVHSLVGTAYFGPASREVAGIKRSHIEAAEQHRAIVAAIGAGDVAQARAAMELHINTFIRKMRLGPPGDPHGWRSQGLVHASQHLTNEP
jgi:DNA-binding FadR family transcriptional regulator